MIVRDVLIVAAEASADLHGSSFVRALRARRPDVHVVGIGGTHLAAEQVDIIERTETFAVMGFVQPVLHAPRHAAVRRDLRRRIESGAVGLVVLLDYPGFNMKIARIAHDAGVPVLYYITPQVWAWGIGRLAEFARNVTRAACILPFEESLLRQHGVDATFVGHPLLDRIAALPLREQARTELGLAQDARVLALFPGSRAQEIARIMQTAVATAELLRTRVPELRVIVSVAPTVDIRDGDVPFPLVRSASFAALRAADAALCKSGTTTLEAALAGCPLVVVYKTDWLTFAIARRVVKIPRIGLVNVVADRAVAPELVQDAFTATAAADLLGPLLDWASPERVAMVGELARVRSMLGTPGAADRVAAMADAMLA